MSGPVGDAGGKPPANISEVSRSADSGSDASAKFNTELSDARTNVKAQSTSLEQPSTTTPLDTATRVTESFRSESDIHSGSLTTPRDSMRSAARGSGRPVVESGQAVFDTVDHRQPVKGQVFTSDRGTFVKTPEGNHFEVVKGPDGRTALQSGDGARIPVRGESSVTHPVNQPIEGPAKVHRQAKPEVQTDRNPVKPVETPVANNNPATRNFEGRRPGGQHQHEVEAKPQTDARNRSQNPDGRPPGGEVPQSRNQRPEAGHKYEVKSEVPQDRGRQPEGRGNPQGDRNQGKQPGEQQERRVQTDRGDRGTGQSNQTDQGDGRGRGRRAEQRADQTAQAEVDAKANKGTDRPGSRERGKGEQPVERGKVETTAQKGDAVKPGETGKSLQDALKNVESNREGTANKGDAKNAGKLSDLVQGKSALDAANLKAGAKGPIDGAAKDLGKPAQGQEALSKQMGLDLNKPQTKQFLTELGKRMQALTPAESGNVKLQDVLKGLDPTSSRTLENFLTKGQMKGSELTLNQLDQGNLKSLRMLLDGQAGKSTALDTANVKQATLKNILKQVDGKPINLESPNAKTFGQNLQEVGRQLRMTNLNNAESNLKLADITGKSIDGKLVTANSGKEFATKLSQSQEQTVKSLIENSGKLANLIESGKINLIKGAELGNTRMDASGSILSDVMVRLPGSMQGSNFIVKGEAIGNLAAIEVAQQFIRSDAAATQGLMITTRPDGSQVLVSPVEILSGKPIDPVTGLPYDPFTGKLLDPTTGRIIGNVRPGEQGGKLSGKWDADSKWDNEKRQNLEQEEYDRNKRKAMLIAAKAAKARRIKEIQEKAKKEKQEKALKEDKKRTKYIVKAGDTLESIAVRKLRDARIAALIYNINKKVIPIIQINGKDTVDLKEGLVLWLPSPYEVRNFKSQLMSGDVTPASKPATADGSKEYATPEEELAARYGESWSGSDTDDDGANSGSVSVENELIAKAVKESKRRKENIEKVLGPLSSGKEKPQDKKGRELYKVRLGDSLKSVAMRHPFVRDITLWKLIAEINKLSTATNASGTPKSKLVRGTEIKIPTKEEINDYREKMGFVKALSTKPGVKARKPSDISPDMHLCDNCGRMTVISARVCDCGKPIVAKTKPLTKSKTKKVSDTKIDPKSKKASPRKKEEKTKKSTSQTGADMRVKPSVTQDAVETKLDLNSDTAVNHIAEGSKPDSPGEVKWSDIKELDSITRLLKLEKRGTAPLKYALEVQIDGRWISLVSYEIGDSKTLRHDDFSGKNRKSVKIDLPAKAAEELARNDLTGNWKNYKRKFIRTKT